MTGTTPEGVKAYGLLRMANANRARLPDAVRGVDELALGLMARRTEGAGRALAEVQDVGRVLARLSPAPVTLSTISSQVIELDWDELRHPRDAHGRFIHIGGGSGEAHARAHATASASAKAHLAARKASEGPDPDKIIKDIQARADKLRTQKPDPAKAELTDKTAADLKRAMARLDLLEKEVQSLRKDDTISKKELAESNLRQKRIGFTASVLSAVAGGVLAYFTDGIGFAAAPVIQFAASKALEKMPELLFSRAEVSLHAASEKHSWAEKVMDWLEHPGKQTAKGAVAGAKVVPKVARATPVAVKSVASAVASKPKVAAVRQRLASLRAGT